MSNNDDLHDIEKQMQDPAFWENGVRAQEVLKRYNELKYAKDPYENAEAVIRIIAGAGGVDAEDFTRMLFEMYSAYAKKVKWNIVLLSEQRNTHNGIKRIDIEVQSKDAYGVLKSESGVHRLVRKSPFNTKGLRHTSFALVEVIPKIEQKSGVEIRKEDVDISFSRASGAGGQNVNKRDTAVRVVHKSTGIVVRIEEERTQERNKEKALQILRGHLLKRMEQEGKDEIDLLRESKDSSIEWGEHIRSYVLHPYRLVKDVRTGYEDTNPESVFAGNIEGFLEYR